MKRILLAIILLSACGQGPQGIPGQNGAPSPIGPQLPDGTTVTPVQFCPGVSPTYPSTFPEYGLCIEGSLYAVYSANDGFLTLIPPGQYQSNAIGSNCNFTVLSGCEVTQ